MDADRIVAADEQKRREDFNVSAFLHMIRCCEGTDHEDGYRALFGYTPTNGKIFDSFADHPRRSFSFKQTDGTLNYTTAAGAYQFIARTWDSLKYKLGLPDFGPDSQDEAAIYLIRECGALPDVKAGNIGSAIDRCSKIWASLPASHYPQPKRTRQFARAAFEDAGGVLA